MHSGLRCPSLSNQPFGAFASTTASLYLVMPSIVWHSAQPTVHCAAQVIGLLNDFATAIWQLSFYKSQLHQPCRAFKVAVSHSGHSRLRSPGHLSFTSFKLPFGTSGSSCLAFCLGHSRLPRSSSDSRLRCPGPGAQPVTPSKLLFGTLLQKCCLALLVLQGPTCPPSRLLFGTEATLPRSSILKGFHSFSRANLPWADCQTAALKVRRWNPSRI